MKNPPPDPNTSVSTTHHNFIVEPWPGARPGAVRVADLDDPDHAVLLLQPADVQGFCTALLAAANGSPIYVDVHDVDHGRIPS